MYFTMRAQSHAHPWNGSDRAWLCRWLEVTTTSLKELHVMRREAEQRVRGVLDEEQSSHESDWMRWERHMAAEETLVKAVATKIRRNLDMDQSKPKKSELGHIQEEVVNVRLCRDKEERNQHEMSPAQTPDLDHSWSINGKSQERNDPTHNLVRVDHVRGLTRKLAQGIQEQVISPKSTAEQTQEELVKLVRTSARQNQEKMDIITSSTDEYLQSQKPIWPRPDATEPAHNPEDVDKAMDQSEESPALNDGSELPLSVFPTEFAPLRRIGSGSLTPRLRLGSSGVTSDLLFTRRMSGNCLSAHSSGFYEASDVDSTSSSCSSLCSDTSCHTSISVMSPHRSLAMRPRSIDCTTERRQELQNGRVQTKRPVSAGAVDGYFLLSVSNSRCDIAHSNHMTPCDYPFSDTPPLCAIQQRRKTERYICKLALKYRCKPGVTTLPADLGPPTPRRPVLPFLRPDCRGSCPPSPQVSSLSTSLGDVRKPPRGSWGRFLSRVMLRKDSRTAASELNLDQCGQSPRGSLQGSSLTEGQLLRAKSFRDLLSVNPFKRNQKGLNKAW
ncbi:uncharacterized protein LOC142103567 [Mixophyes fleayi]|uniref:uncharacterized protein LOC142103567 n=1 Tax=Mixophyes fleayi TaxID=3061075 RepID=UPI003F4DD8E7